MCDPRDRSLLSRAHGWRPPFPSWPPPCGQNTACSSPLVELVHVAANVTGERLCLTLLVGHREDSPRIHGLVPSPLCVRRWACGGRSVAHRVTQLQLPHESHRRTCRTFACRLAGSSVPESAECSGNDRGDGRRSRRNDVQSGITDGPQCAFAGLIAQPLPSAPGVRLASEGDADRDGDNQSLHQDPRSLSLARTP